MAVDLIKKQLKDIKAKIKKACKKSRRDPSGVKVIISSRNRKVPEIREVIDAGCRIFGENRVQEAVQKTTFLDDVEWHLVGHLQTVKARAAVKVFDLIHTVDGLRIGFDLRKACEKLKKDVDILIQVNTTDENAQFGALPSETIPLIKELVKFDRVHIRGLMTEFPPTEDPEEARPYFKRLRELSEEIRKAGIDGIEMKWLSMGFSENYQIAIEEGSNIIRISSPIFPED